MCVATSCRLSLLFPHRFNPPYALATAPGWCRVAGGCCTSARIRISAPAFVTRPHPYFPRYSRVVLLFSRRPGSLMCSRRAVVLSALRAMWDPRWLRAARRPCGDTLCRRAVFQFLLCESPDAHSASGLSCIRRRVLCMCRLLLDSV